MGDANATTETPDDYTTEDTTNFTINANATEDWSTEVTTTEEPTTEKPTTENPTTEKPTTFGETTNVFTTAEGSTTPGDPNNPGERYMRKIYEINSGYKWSLM